MLWLIPRKIARTASMATSFCADVGPCSRHQYSVAPEQDILWIGVKRTHFYFENCAVTIGLHRLYPPAVGGVPDLDPDAVQADGDGFMVDLVVGQPVEVSGAVPPYFAQLTDGVRRQSLDQLDWC